MTVVSLDMAYRYFLEVLAGSHPPRYAASLKPSSPRFTHSSCRGAELAHVIRRSAHRSAQLCGALCRNRVPTPERTGHSARGRIGDEVSGLTDAAICSPRAIEGAVRASA